MRRFWQRGIGPEDEAKVADAWRHAEPFPHLVLDDFVPSELLDELLAIVDEEPIKRYEGDIFAFEASSPAPRTEGFIRLRDAFGAAMSAPLSRITSKAVTRADMRAYAYGSGHYLLPHTDHQKGVRRALAFAYYLPTPEPPRGGELELYTCRVAGTDTGTIVATETARLIEPKGNRLAVFDVSDISLHQVREVLGGLRISLAGWFYP